MRSQRGARDTHDEGRHRNYFFRAFPCCACLALHACFVLRSPDTQKKIAPVLPATRASARVLVKPPRELFINED